MNPSLFSGKEGQLDQARALSSRYTPRYLALLSCDGDVPQWLRELADIALFLAHTDLAEAALSSLGGFQASGTEAP